MLADHALPPDACRPGGPWLALTRLPLPHRPEAVFRARRHTRGVLAPRCADDELAATAELVVSELVTNAVRHGICPCGCTRGAVSLALFASGDRLRVEVTDPSRTPPRWPTGVRAVDADAAEGRGLLLVTRLAADWGDLRRRYRGKTVWCELGEGGPRQRRSAAVPAQAVPSAPPPEGPPQAAGAATASAVLPGASGASPSATSG